MPAGIIISALIAAAPETATLITEILIGISSALGGGGLAAAITYYVLKEDKKKPIPNVLKNATDELEKASSETTLSLHKKIEEKTQAIAEKQTELNDTQIKLTKTSHELSTTAKISEGLATKSSESAEKMTEEFKTLHFKIRHITRKLKEAEAQVLSAEKELRATTLRTSEESKKVSKNLDRSNLEVASIADKLKQSEQLLSKKHRSGGHEYNKFIRDKELEIEKLKSILEELSMELISKNEDNRKQGLEITALAASNKRLVGVIQRMTEAETGGNDSHAPAPSSGPSSGNILMFRS